jgi:D-alanine-D-alanine ligase
LKIALLCGGVSPEREISLASGKNVAHALRSRGYTVVVVDPAYGADQPDEAEIFSFSIKNEPVRKNGNDGISERNYIDAVQSALPDDTSVVFITLHGTWGEDGKVQSLLDMRGLPYTGSGVLASAMAMDKIVTKRLLMSAGILTPVWIGINAGDERSGLRNAVDAAFGYPAVVKPSDQGSTVGLTIIANEDQLETAVSAAFAYSDRVLIEAYIAGRELTVAILGDSPLPVIEIRPKQGFYDYANKYTPGNTDYLVPAPVDDAVRNKVSEAALSAFTTLGCSGYGRVDFRMNEAGESYCLEVNTAPGMTGTSLVPKAANAVGIEYEDLCERIVKYALNRSSL